MVAERLGWLWQFLKIRQKGSLPHQLTHSFVAGRGTPSRAQVGSCLTLGNELSEETHMLRKPETLLGRSARAETIRVGEPRRTALPCGSQSQVLW